MIVMPNIEIQRAKVAYGHWRGAGWSKPATFAALASEQGESDFRLNAAGDRDKVTREARAFGIFQWHLDRVLAMAAPKPKGAGIDVRTAGHLDQLRAALWEMTVGPEKRTGQALARATTIEDAVTVFVKVFERSARQASDIEKRVGYARYWAEQFKDAA